MAGKPIIKVYKKCWQNWIIFLVLLIYFATVILISAIRALMTRGNGKGFAKETFKKTIFGFDCVAFLRKQNFLLPKMQKYGIIAYVETFYEKTAEKERIFYNAGEKQPERLRKYGSVVKRLRHRPFTAVTRVRFPSESLVLILWTFSSVG